ncbi:MAG: dienelactone hydrolase [Gammaproteobacteria bacterium]|jgi:carboxymethylenebutenolidase|nr:dienelactone hydrolase [Gammaproteobacteria bacterium]MCH2578110.1 dienelactone hydrolase family protein [Pseudomonadales bacterium]MEC7765942.1 dienelactone hydrolase family protein [Pseudomonadota bacterium]MBI91467.1 dienelactone hydrolase [Gammaproteobacteria bacterium]MEC8950351.1 dienelactone hydrolase family protein [Pseudomonadota bacterium]|tara:strand:+ start:6914 stop:7792 length:879 start_codon:yes stop_codon:yes gene_type:complete
MCDEETQKEVEEYLRSHPEITRRDFTKLATGAGLALMFPPMVNAQAVSERDVNIETPDGVADCYFVYPSMGAHAAVLVWPDILALRPAFREMGKRLARSGYAVLTVNPFYRDAHAPVVGRGASFSQPEIRNHVLPMARNLNAETHFTDARAFAAWLDDQPEVDTNRGIGTTGYCMGGPMVMRTVAAVPDRFAAGATFHGGGLATNAPDSPHLLIPQTQAQILHCIAENDDDNDPQAKVTLRDAYDAAGIAAEIEVYEDAMHGWCAIDSQVYHEAQAEHAWSRLLNLFQNALA